MVDVVGGFEIEKTVARSDGGTLRRGRDPRLGRTVALKCVTDPRSPAADRLRGEGRLLGTLRHPHIVNVYELLEDSSGVWLVEEWVDGHTLAGVVERWGRLTAEQGIGVVHAALEGLAFAHERGIVHGDVSLTNILVDQAGVSKLIDFGLARSPGEGESSESTYGTPGFSSPQVVAGAAPTLADDVYAAGAVLAALLLGRALFAGTTTQAILAAQRRSSGSTSDLKGITPDVRNVLTNALAPDRADRYPDAAAFLAALDGAAERDHGPNWLAEASLATVMAGLGGGAVTATLSSGTTTATAPETGAQATTGSQATTSAGAAGVAAAVSAHEASTRTAKGGVRTLARNTRRAGRLASRGQLVGAAALVVVVVVATVSVVVHQRSQEPPGSLTAATAQPASTGAPTPAATSPSVPTPSVSSTQPVAPASLTWSKLGKVGDGDTPISCPSETFCAVSNGIAQTKTFRGVTFASQEGDDVSCVSDDFCLAVTAKSYLKRWNGKRYVDFEDFTDNHTGASQSGTVSCASKTFCIATQNSSVSRWNGSDWAESQIDSQDDEFGGYQVIGSSCASKSLCAFTSVSGELPNPPEFAALWNGQRWTSARRILSHKQSSFSTAVSCAPESTFCMAAGKSYTVTDGKTWTKARSVPDLGGSGIVALSCPAETFCVGVGGKKAFIWNGTDWTSADVGRDLTTVSCLPSFTCFAADREGNVVIGRPEGQSPPVEDVPAKTSAPASKTDSGPSGCGTVTAANGDELRVIVKSGGVSCGAARKVFAKYISDSTPKSGSGYYAEFDGWSCMTSSAAEFDENGWVWNCQGDRGETETRCGSNPPASPGETPTLCQLKQ